MKKYKNAVLVDWHNIAADHPEFFYDDGIHLRPEGATAYAQLIAERLWAAASRRNREPTPVLGAPCAKL